MNSPTKPCSCRSCTNGGQACDTSPETFRGDLPPVAVGYLDDRSRWFYPSLKPIGFWGWAETAAVLLLCLPVLVVFGPLVLVLRAFDKE